MIKIKTVTVGIERSVCVAPYTYHKVRIEVAADVPEDSRYRETLEALHEVISADVNEALNRERAEYKGGR